MELDPFLDRRRDSFWASILATAAHRWYRPANLVCVLTKTHIYENIGEMIKTSLVPFVATCILYYIGTIDECRSDGWMWKGCFPIVLCFTERGNPGGDYPGAVCVPVEVKKTMLISIVLAAFERGAAGADNRRNFTDVSDRLSGQTIRRSMP